MPAITTIGFDADDTLWHNESIFEDAHRRYCALLARWHDADERNFPTTLKRLVARLGEPVVRGAVKQAMRILAGQFVLAETIEDAVQRGTERRPYRFSFDMLGEAARTAEDAANYLASYTRAIRAVKPPEERPC